MEKKKEVATATRAEKKDRAKNLIRETLSKKEYKHNELIDETARLYAERFAGEETDNINDVRGRIGSILDVMKKEGEVLYDGGVYALKAETSAEKPKKSTRKTTKKSAEKAEKESVTEEKPKKRATKKKTEEPIETVEPVLPVDPVPAPVVIPDPEPAKTEVPKEITAKKRGGRKKKTEEKKEEVKEVKEEVKTEEPVLPQPIEEMKTEEITENKAETAVVVVPKGEIAEKNVVDMSFLFGGTKPQKEKNTIDEVKKLKPIEPQETRPVKAEEKKEKAEVVPVKAETKSVKTETKPIEKKPAPVKKQETKKPTRTMTADERLKESYLKRLHRLGGDYFEYYSVYLLERYCRNNGRRLEGLKITAGDRDGGIDGEIELTDKFGFRETIYIQAKNWDPEKGDEKLWVVGETLVQQFIGACACRQAKEGKQRCRGIFITTSRFTPEAKAVLDTMSEQIIGYDGSDLYEAAKECQFGIIKRNGEWVLDENLLSSGKVFFTMF